MIEAVYSSFAGVEIPVQSIYMMTWKAKLGTRYSAIINENTGRPVEVILVIDNYMEFAKILQTVRDENIVIDLATVDLESILPSIPLVKSDFYKELAEETKSEIDGIIAEINKYFSRVQSSTDNVNRYKENMSEEERLVSPQYIEEADKLETRIKRLEKNKVKLINLLNAESVIADEALTIREARELPEWSDNLELEFLKISDPDAYDRENNAFDMSSNEEDEEDEIMPNDAMQMFAQQIGRNHDSSFTDDDGKVVLQGDDIV